jgi:hypothetical protein
MVSDNFLGSEGVLIVKQFSKITFLVNNSCNSISEGIQAYKE